MSRAGWFVPEHAFLLLAMFACVAGGGARTWQLGVLVAGSGLILLFARIEARPSRPAAAAAFLAALIPLLAFLPESLLPDRSAPPTWRTVLADAGLTPSGGTLTPQPWVTAEAALLSAFAVVLIVTIPTLAWSDPVRRRVFTILSGFVCLLALVSLAAAETGTRVPLWLSDLSGGIGPFANRNHFGTLLAISTAPVLTLIWACGRQGDAVGMMGWIAGGTCLVLAAVVNGSRAGVLLVGFAGLAWIIVTGWRLRSPRFVALATCVLGAAVFLVLRASPAVMDRFAAWSADGAPTGAIQTSEGGGRVPIYLDTAAAIGESPWLGHGLGNFGAVFALQREQVTSNNRVLHPESDWLWLAHEGGVPFALAFAVLAGLLVAPVFTNRGERRLDPALTGFVGGALPQAAVLIAGGVMLIHSVVDIPGHVPAVLLVVVLLLAAGLPRDAMSDPAGARGAGTRRTAWWIRAAGICMVTVGLGWLLTGAGWAAILPASAAKRAVQIAWSSGLDEAFPGTSAAYRVERLAAFAAIVPLDWRLRLMLGEAAIASGSEDLAVHNFRGARLLAPESEQVPMAEARAWEDVAPIRAFSVLQTAALQSPPSRGPLFREAVALTMRQPALRPLLIDFASIDASLLVSYLTATAHAGEEFTGALNMLLDGSEALDSLDRASKRSVLDAWWKKGDRAALRTHLESRTHAERDDFAAELLARLLAEAGDEAGAMAEARRALEARGRSVDVDATWREIERELRASRRAAPKPPPVAASP